MRLTFAYVDELQIITSIKFLILYKAYVPNVLPKI